LKLAQATFAILLLAAGIPLAARSQEHAQVLLMARGEAGVEVADAVTLNTLGFLSTGQTVYNSLVRPDGRMLFLAQSRPSEPNSCCALYALELARKTLTFLIWPAQGAALSPDSTRLYTQRGNTEIDLVDLERLRRAPSIGKPGKNYGLYPSPDGRWLFGITAWPGPATLEILDLQSGEALRKLPVPDLVTEGHTSWPLGTWLGDTFYVFAYAGGQARLWAVRPDTETLTGARRIYLPRIGKPCNCTQSDGSTRQPVPMRMIAAGNHLIIYEAFGGKLDRRAQGESVSGGAYVIEPSTGEVKADLDPALYLSDLVASTDGSELYGIALHGSPGHAVAELIKLDAQDGRILASRQLSDPSVAYSLVLAELPATLVPNGKVRLDTPAEVSSK
jgi:hypothetical protein